MRGLCVSQLGRFAKGGMSDMQVSVVEGRHLSLRMTEWAMWSYECFVARSVATDCVGNVSLWPPGGTVKQFASKKVIKVL